jgi:hypothetical protein
MKKELHVDQRGELHLQSLPQTLPRKGVHPIWLPQVDCEPDGVDVLGVAVVHQQTLTLIRSGFGAWAGLQFGLRSVVDIHIEARHRR